MGSPIPSLARQTGNVVVLRLRDIPGVPTDLAPITLVYAKGDAQDVLALVERGEDVTIRTDYETPLERAAVEMALIRAE